MGMAQFSLCLTCRIKDKIETDEKDGEEAITVESERNNSERMGWKN